MVHQDFRGMGVRLISGIPSPAVPKFSDSVGRCKATGYIHEKKIRVERYKPRPAA